MKLATGFEAAFIGVTKIWNGPDVAVYSEAKCIEVLQERGGMDYDEAREFFEFNVSGAYVGEDTPLFVDTEMDLDTVHEVYAE